MNEEAALRHIFRRLAGGQSIALIAPTQVDPTKLLQQIGNPQIYSLWLPQAPHWVFDYIAARQFKANETAADFWRRVWQSFAGRAVNQPWHGLIEDLAESSGLKSDRILRQLDQREGKLVLLLDDLDQLAENPRLFTPDLLGPLRSLSSRHQSFSVVFTSQRRLSELNRLVAMSGSPPFNNFNEILLSEFAIT
ncbi:MAG: hypothetical protein DPW09_42535 [Anaerolineae bacterium]|nr:hypothetical protein [Anaerolineae bacterium]